MIVQGSYQLNLSLIQLEAVCRSNEVMHALQDWQYIDADFEQKRFDFVGVGNFVNWFGAEQTEQKCVIVNFGLFAVILLFQWIWTRMTASFRMNVEAYCSFWMAYNTVC